MAYRNPSIHIGKNHLILVLKELFDNNTPIKWNYEKLANEILLKSKQYSLTNRNTIIDTAKLYKSTNKVLLSTRDDAGVFANLLTLVRRQKNHRGISLLKVGSKEWPMIKEVTKLAISFCNDFDLKREDGFKIYIGLALDKMTKFNLARFNNVHQFICDEYEAKNRLELDLTKQLTSRAVNHYQKLLGERVGIVNDFSNQPLKMICFMEAKNTALKYNIEIETYIAAQFKGFEWCNSYPEPAQLIGNGSIDRLNKYLIANKIRANSTTNNSVEDAAKELMAKFAKNKKK